MEFFSFPKDWYYIMFVCSMIHNYICLHRKVLYLFDISFFTFNSNPKLLVISPKNTDEISISFFVSLTCKQMYNKTTTKMCRHTFNGLSFPICIQMNAAL